MEIYKKTQIIQEFYEEVLKIGGFEEFMTKNDLGIPLSIALNNKLIKGLTDEGESLVQETWFELCSHQMIDPNGNYNSISDVLPTLVDDEDDDPEDQE